MKVEYLKHGGCFLRVDVKIVEGMLDQLEGAKGVQIGYSVHVYDTKGGLLEYKDRGISLLSVPGIMYGRIIAEGVTENTERKIGEGHSGFSKRTSCVYQMFISMQVCEKIKKIGRDLCCVYGCIKGV